ncbi:MAG TPA: tRNA (adenosine(37)-N6)-threonylcarbamoyltransferase complex dimerization subunit type 1 TsaB [Chromatiaceae bacterium]|nr:tRNA (adenosine(37)-N6)-threonylcarbamoyltransferase complex dimerization subunit type 1 TsaB [Chromatiaceae bacterium]
MRLLAIDTTENACSAALLLDGELKGRFQLAPRRHGELLLPMIDSLLAEAQLTARELDGVAFSRGPGSFTGIRIATGVAQGIALGADLPVAPVSTLLALARGAMEETGARNLLAALDARMGELYWAAVRSGRHGMEIQGGEMVAPPTRVEAQPRDDWVAIGSGWDSYLEQLMPRFRPVKVLHDRQIDARQVARLGADLLERGGGVPAEQALPVYLRNQVAKKSAVEPPN